jgi:hypothetical protein
MLIKKNTGDSWREEPMGRTHGDILEYNII